MPADFSDPALPDSPGAEHRKAKEMLLMDLRELREFAQQLQLPEIIARIDRVVERVEKSFFTVAVVGEFKRGKSTLINALLGEYILPADVIPTTATLNRLTYGLVPHAEVVFKAVDGQPERRETIGLDRLADYVTKLTAESEQMASTIQEAVVFHNIKYLEHQADIIDTPGLNDEATMTEVTYSVLPTADASILVILATSPFSGVEGDFLKHMLTTDIGRVIFVVNRIDELRKPEDRTRVIDIVAARIEKTVKDRASKMHGAGTPDYERYIQRIGKPQVYGLSAQQALEAKQAGDEALLAASGFKRFEAALERFLVVERGAVQLQVLADAALAASAQILLQIGVRENSLRMSQTEFEAAYQAESAKLQSLRERHAAETAKIDQAAARTRNRLRPLVMQMESEMRQALDRTVDEAVVTPKDIDPQRRAAFSEKLRARVVSQMQQAGQLQGEKMEWGIERDLEDEVKRLEDFAFETGKVLGEIEVHFRPVTADDQTQRNLVAQSALALVPMIGSWLTGWGLVGGGFVAGYRQAGLKGAVVGGGAGLAAGATAGIVAVAVATTLALPMLPVALAAIAASGLASYFGGGWVAGALFGADRVENFKTNFKRAMHQQLDQFLNAQRVDVVQRLDEQIDQAYAALKQNVQAELGDPVEQTQQTLDDLRARRARSETLTERDLQELDKQRAQTRAIQERANSRSQRLREMISV